MYILLFVLCLCLLLLKSYQLTHWNKENHLVTEFPVVLEHFEQIKDMRLVFLLEDKVFQSMNQIFNWNFDRPRAKKS